MGSEDVLSATVENSGYVEKRRKISQYSNGPKRRGIGLSFFFHGAGFTGSGEAKMEAQAGVEITPEGRARVLTGSTEIGQGTRTIFCQIVAEELGVGYDDVEIEEPNTSRVPDSGPTVASRTCMIVGRVVQFAAREAKEILPRFVAERYGEADAQLIDGWFIAGEKRLASFGEIVREYIKLYGQLRAFARYANPPGVEWDDDTYTGDAYPVFSLRRRGRRGRSGYGYLRSDDAQNHDRAGHRPRHPSSDGRRADRRRNAASGRLRIVRGTGLGAWARCEQPPDKLHHPDVARRA